MKKKLLIVLLVIFIVILCFLIWFFKFREQKIAIITYHYVVDSLDQDNSVNISTDYFRKQMEWLKKHNFKTITMDEFYKWKKGKLKLPRKSVLITFDDGWKSTYKTALPILEENNFVSNVFVIYHIPFEHEDVNYINKDDFNDIMNNHKSMHLLSHSYNLHNEGNAHKDDYDFYVADIKKVEDINKDVKYYAYPYGYSNENYRNALKDSGYKLAFTFGPYDFARKSDDE